MISVHLSDKGVVNVKPLQVLWGLYPQYSPQNTIMIDDIARNFAMNPQTGLRIRPYRITRRATDKELRRITEYLRLIALQEPDFTKLDHSKWSHYN